MSENMTRWASTKRIAESVVITMAIPALGYSVDREDPFFLHHRFPWLVFAPLLVALRHGFRLGVSSACILIVLLIGAWRTRLAPMAAFPGEPVVGLVGLAMIAGQFADLWRRDVLRRDGDYAVLKSEADRLARAHFLLEASHDRLDEQMQRTTSTLRDAIDAVSALLPDVDSLHTHGEAILDVFTTYCGIEIGELYSIRGGEIGARCACAGRPEAMRPDNPLLLQALRSGRLTYLPIANLSGRARLLVAPVDSALLAAVPFVDSAGVVRAVLCAQAMPFLSFEKRNLDTMVTIAASFADRLAQTSRRRDGCSSHARGATA